MIFKEVAVACIKATFQDTRNIKENHHKSILRLLFKLTILQSRSTDHLSVIVSHSYRNGQIIDRHMEVWVKSNFNTMLGVCGFSPARE
jgi:hypothetical protein